MSKGTAPSTSSKTANCRRRSRPARIGVFHRSSTKATGADLIPPGVIGDDLAFYIDGGGIYRFGNEYNGRDSNTTATFGSDPNSVLVAGSSETVDNGMVQATIRTTATFTSKDAFGQPVSGTYVRGYTLVGEEPFLRMSFTGGPPLTASGQPNSSDPGDGNQYAVMIRFPLADPKTGRQVKVDDVTYGTPYHWVTQLPVAYWPTPTFQAMHDFLLPQAGTRVLGGDLPIDHPRVGDRHGRRDDRLRPAKHAAGPGRQSRGQRAGYRLRTRTTTQSASRAASPRQPMACR